jgi:rod shape-determining protein MreC
MDFLLGRYRNLTILVGVLFLQVLGLAVQVKRIGDAQSTRLIRIWAVDTITPFEKTLVWSQNGGRDLWRNYFFLRGVRAENRELKAQIDQMRLQQVRLSEDAEQAHRLQQLMGFREQVISKTVAAQVIGSSASDLSRSIYIDKGSNDKIAPDMAVITAGGIVGKVLRVYPSTALILMINDQSSGVGAMLEKSRLQGVLRGTPDGEIVLERVMSDEQVNPGDTVLSSGGDQIFPKGMPVGTVTSVKPGHEMFLNIHVKPAADLSRLEEVLVVTEKQEQNPMAETGVRVRAADILAERLPTVPEKPANAASDGASATSGTSAANSSSGPKTSGASQSSAPSVSASAASSHPAATNSNPPTGAPANSSLPGVNGSAAKPDQTSAISSSGKSTAAAQKKTGAKLPGGVSPSSVKAGSTTGATPAKANPQAQPAQPKPPAQSAPPASTGAEPN